jgi:signal transduction histidine kinase
MNSKSSAAGDFKAPLPTRQFQGFLLFFHIVIVAAMGLTLFAHLHRTKELSRPDFILAGLVPLQILLYLCFFALPSLADHGGAQGRFGAIFRDMNEYGRANPRLALRFLAAFIVVSVVLVLAECRIEPAFQWALIAYVGMVSALPFRISVPAAIAILGAWLLNRFGWSGLATWEFGRWFDMLMQVVPGGVFLLFMGRIIVTSGERGKLITELQAAKQALELARDSEVELAALRERERLARDLHDTLGHALVTLTVQLEAAQRLQAADPARVPALLTELQKLTRSSMEDLRRSLANLRTSGLGDRPLAGSLQTLCAEAGRRSGAAVDCHVAEGADALPPAVAEVLWRVVQEGLTNVERHAHARQVAVNLALPPKEVVLRVSDDGVGLPPGAEEKPGHYGLRGLRERVEGLGGTFWLTSAEPRGTLIEARIPLIA